MITWRAENGQFCAKYDVENLKIAIGNRAGIRENRAISGQNVGEDWGEKWENQGFRTPKQGKSDGCLPKFREAGRCEGLSSER